MHWIPGPFLAHAFGQVYNLPVPLWLYLYGGAAAVVLSFLVVGYVVNEKQLHLIERGRRIANLSSLTQVAAQLLALALLVFTIAAGWLGQQSAATNFSVTFFWVVIWLGLTYLVAILGNFWSWINPAILLTRLKLRPQQEYPAWLGYYPALAAYFGFIWLELLSGGLAIVPRNLAFILLTYSAITAAGLLWFGTVWLERGEFFCVFFNLVGRLSPIEYRNDQIRLRWPLIGLLQEEPVRHFSRLLFILFMLTSTAFDGWRETFAFSDFYNFTLAHLPLRTLPPGMIQTVLLVLALSAFLGVYWLFMRLIKLLVKTDQTTSELALKFAPTLVPIAVAYNAAHYYSLLVIQGQLMIKLLSDPLGRGWNLFHTAGYRINVGLLNAAQVWYSQVILIVLGHIGAIYLAHLVALKVFPSTKKAILSQYPMLILMVIYTMTSLWIIAQPITR